MGLVNSTRDSLVLLKCALYIEEKSTTAAKKKKKRKMQIVNAQNMNQNRTYTFITKVKKSLNLRFSKI